MNNTEFLREFGKILMRPTTKSTALDLYEAYQGYCVFLKLVANGVLQKFMHFGERCIEDCENLWRESEDNQGEPTRDDIYGFFEDDMWARLYEAWKDECDEWCDLIGEEKALEWFDEGARSWLEKRFSSALG